MKNQKRSIHSLIATAAALLACGAAQAAQLDVAGGDQALLSLQQQTQQLQNMAAQIPGISSQVQGMQALQASNLLIASILLMLNEQMTRQNQIAMMGSCLARAASACPTARASHAAPR